MHLHKHHYFTITLLFLVTLFTACSRSTQEPPSTSGESDDLKIVATTTIVGDVVANVAGNDAEIAVLLPPGTDPHSFEPTPQDIVLVSDADVVFVNGAGLEEFLDKLIESAGAADRVVEVNQGVALINSNADSEHNEGIDGNESSEHDGDSHDPHTWTNPQNVLIWVDNIRAALSEVDPQNASMYQANIIAYQSELRELDAWISERVSEIPEAKRIIVTDHKIFNYFAEEYDFTQVGAVVPGYSTMAQPSAQDLAALEDAIKEYGVQAIFVGNTINPSLSQRVAEDTGINLIYVYTGSLGESSSGASTYLDYIRYNVNSIVDALK